MESRIKRIESTKEWGQGDRKVIYHNLEMENGDKINIGKKKLQQEGWELMYEIDDTSQEYNKAHAVVPDDKKSFDSNPQSTTTQMNVNDSILYQVCLKEATQIIAIDGFDGNQTTPEKIQYICDIAYELARLSKDNIEKLSK